MADKLKLILETDNIIVDRLKELRLKYKINTKGEYQNEIISEIKVNVHHSNVEIELQYAKITNYLPTIPKKLTNILVFMDVEKNTYDGYGQIYVKYAEILNDKIKDEKLSELFTILNDYLVMVNTFETSLAQFFSDSILSKFIRLHSVTKNLVIIRKITSKGWDEHISIKWLHPSSTHIIESIFELLSQHCDIFPTLS